MKSKIRKKNWSKKFEKKIGHTGNVFLAFKIYSAFNNQNLQWLGLQCNFLKRRLKN